MSEITNDNPQENKEEQDLENNMNVSQLEVQKVQNAALSIKSELGKVIIGQSNMINQLLIALFSDGHVLIEGVPGIAKTLTAKLLAQAISLDFSRIQFTPDLMPTDILGTSVFNLKDASFEFKAGPIFSNLILIDEINRSPAKTQAALFEVMEEKQATIDGKRIEMALPFFVMATQNPVEQEGTYKLPEAQLDRFLFKIKLQHPNLEEEVEILQRFKNDFKQDVKADIKAVIDNKLIFECTNIIQQVYIKDDLIKYIAEIVDNTRNNSDIFLGASPRASLAIMKTSKAHAAMNGRDFVTPDDIQAMCYPVLNHRIILTPDKEMEGLIEEDIIREIIEKIEVPR